MSCSHTNPAGYLFCGQCGEALDPARCRCGFAAATGDSFCGRCGASLAAGEMRGGRVVDVDHRIDLAHLAQQAAQEKQFLETTHKARVTQEDIRKLLSTRRKRF